MMIRRKRTRMKRSNKTVRRVNRVNRRLKVVLKWKTKQQRPMSR